MNYSAIHTHRSLESSPVKHVQKRDISAEPAKNTSPDFKTLLQEKVHGPVSAACPEKPAESFTVSRHADKRLTARGIPLEPQDVANLERALSTARAKGSRNTLVYYKNNAYLMNVRSNALITAMQTNNMKGSIVTNIDSTVFI